MKTTLALAIVLFTACGGALVDERKDDATASTPDAAVQDASPPTDAGTGDASYVGGRSIEIDRASGAVKVTDGGTRLFEDTTLRCSKEAVVAGVRVRVSCSEVPYTLPNGEDGSTKAGGEATVTIVSDPLHPERNGQVLRFPRSPAGYDEILVAVRGDAASLQIVVTYMVYLK